MNAAICDRPIGGLLGDLKQRGMYEDTIVTFTMECGRTPMRQGSSLSRDDNTGGFTVWMAGAGNRLSGRFKKHAGALMALPFESRSDGECGRRASELFPNVARHRSCRRPTTVVSW